MSILLYPALNKLSTSQWSFFKDYSGTDAEMLTPRIRTNNNSIKIAFTITETIPLNFQVILRSYNTEGNSIVSDVILLDKKWKLGDSRIITLEAYADTNTVAVMFKNLDSPRTTYGFRSFNISNSENNVSTKELEYKATKQKNILYRNTKSAAETTTVFLSDVVRINSDRAWVSIKELTVMNSFKVEYYTNYAGRKDHQRLITLFDGAKRPGNTSPILIPIVPESKEFRIRITNTSPGATSIDLATVDIIEVEEFLPELAALTLSTASTSLQVLDIPSTIELKTQAILSNKYLHFENYSNYSCIYLQIGAYKRTLQPQEKFVFKSTGRETSFSHQTDCGTSNIKFTGSGDEMFTSEPGLDTDISFRNLRAYNIIRPFPLAKNRVWGTKTNDNELWDFSLDDEMNIISETLLQTFDLPVLDIFITSENTMLISTGNIYATDDLQVNFKLYRSEPLNWGVAVTQITIGATSTWFPQTGITECKPAIMFGEYSIFQPQLSVWRSTDDGLTWTQTLTQTSSEIRHFHTVTTDFTNNLDVYVTSGDSGSQLKWWKSTDKGANFTELVTPLGDLKKILGMDIGPEKMIVVTDLPGFRNSIVEVNKSDYSFRILKQTTQVFFGLIRSGACLFAWTLSQHGGNATSKLDYINELFYSLDNGESWKTGWRWMTKSAGGNAGFRYGAWPDRDGNVFLRTDRAILEGHFLNQNSIKISLKR